MRKARTLPEPNVVKLDIDPSLKDILSPFDAEMIVSLLMPRFTKQMAQIPEGHGFEVSTGSWLVTFYRQNKKVRAHITKGTKCPSQPQS